MEQRPGGEKKYHLAQGKAQKYGFSPAKIGISPI